MPPNATRHAAANMSQFALNCRREQTVLEEIFNSITCGIGFCLSVAALVVLIVSANRAGDAWRMVGVSIYGTSLALLFLFSTLYHAIPSKKAKDVFELLDHCTIYVLIAGTYTPFALVTLRGPWGWSLLGTVWGLAFFGIVFKIFFVSRFRVFSAIVYLLMGWLAVVVLRPFLQHLAAAGIGWLLAGGVIYSAGLIFYAWKQLPFHHTVWHVFVLAGSGCHFVAVLKYVLPE
jgi:hemolysin III